MNTPPQHKSRIAQFVDRWQKSEGNEEREARSFLIEFLQDVLGIENPTRVLDFERRVKGRKVDAFYEDMGILIEAKSRKPGILDEPRDNGKYGFETPYQQAKWYRDNLPSSIAPRWIVVTDFDEFRIHDLDTENPETEYVTVSLEDLANPSSLALFGFFFDQSQSRLVKEKELSVEAGEIVGKLYDAFSKQYLNLEDSKDEQRSLNVLIVRLVFLLYAEDAGLLQEHQAFYKYMEKYSASDSRRALIDLFHMLDTPEDKRDPYASADLLAFPYVNGSLFADESIVVPQFTEDLRVELLLNASRSFNWAGISPTIFGAVFESTLNPETRRAGGMHYTSIGNIHKVIEPLFLDDLKAELADIEGEKIEKNRNLMLRAFQQKLAGLNILDPACGSGNFLTESYIQLRKLENRVLENLMGEQMGLGFEGDANPIKVSIDQFYGIEINDFAVAVAKTALWIAESQTMEVTQDLLLMPLDFFPLTTNATIVQGNALRMDWNDVLPASECSYIIGNPPFVGYSNHSKEQQEDRERHFGKCKVVDYVANWYAKAADYMEANKFIRAAFVSTNSITQGQQVEPIWKPLFERGIHIDFAWQTFVWNSEASDQAHVHVVIIGFSYVPSSRKVLFASDGSPKEAGSINGYLQDAPNVFVEKRNKPLCDVPEMAKGFQATDNGTLLLSGEEYRKLVSNDPSANTFIRPFSMGADFIKGDERYCLWLVDATEADIDAHPLIREHVEVCKEWRSNQTPTGDAYKLKDTPQLLRPCGKFKDQTYIGVPKVSSERRDYIPMGFVTNGMIPGDKLYFVPTDSLYVFGVLMSQFHNAWMRTVGGRLKSDYSYANTIVYNNLIFPDPTPEQHTAIEQAAQAVLDARDAHPGWTLAQLYDPDKMPADLLAAHKALDAAVETAYGVDFNGDEEKIVAHLFKLYAEATKD